VLLVMAAGGATLFGTATGFSELLVARAMIGLGVAASLMAGLKAVVIWFPRERIALVNGCMIMLGSLGAVTATAPTDWVLDWIGWRGLFEVLTFATIAVAAFTYFGVPESSSNEAASTTSRLTLWSVYSDARFLRLAPLSAACIGSSWALQSLWAAPWLTDVEGLDRHSLMTQLFIMALAISFGALLLGVMADRLRRRGTTTEILIAGMAGVFIAAELALILRVPTGATSTDDAFAQNGQDRKLAFVNASVDRRTTSPDRLMKQASPFVVQAGTIIPAALITGIRSDLPGLITAQVTENVYDTPTGRARLIPQGARLIGIYDCQIAFGQSRVLLVWTRLIMPNGRSIVLERQPGVDALGYSGLQDEIDNHWKEMLGAAALSTLLAVGTEANSGPDISSTNGAILQALRRGAGDSLNQTGQQVVRRNLNIQPTLTIRPGFPVRVLVNRDLVLETYKG
jgi:MFS family permease